VQQIHSIVPIMESKSFFGRVVANSMMIVHSLMLFEIVSGRLRNPSWIAAFDATASRGSWKGPRYRTCAITSLFGLHDRHFPNPARSPVGQANKTNVMLTARRAPRDLRTAHVDRTGV
jgi:hypothetical protein